MRTPKIGVLIYTYNRTDDAKINMEIIRNVWSKHESLKAVPIVHSYNGEREWWPEKYLEDELLYLENPGHFEGAEILMNEGVRVFQEKYHDVDYVILLASDTWLVKPEYVEKIVKEMQEEKKYLATCVWGSQNNTDMFKKGMSIDFCILDMKWVTKSALFPIRFSDFSNKYQDLFFYNDETIYLEIVFATRFMQAISRTVDIPSNNILKRISESYIYRIVDREPVHIDQRNNFFFKISSSIRKMYWPKIGLITHHDPAPKRKALKEWNLPLGEWGQKLLNTTDLSYYNRGLGRNAFLKNGKEINYGD